MCLRSWHGLLAWFVCCEQGMQSKQKYFWVILRVWKAAHSPSWLGLSDHPLHSLDTYVGLRSTLASCAWGRNWGCSVICKMRLGPFCCGVWRRSSGCCSTAQFSRSISDLLVCAHEKRPSICLPSWEDGAWSLHFSALFRVPLPEPRINGNYPALSLDQEQDKEDAWAPSM